jgi:hypothetical protein
MMRGQIEVELHQKGGSVINVMQRVSPITIQLLKALYVPLTLTLICKPTQPKHLIWQISYGYLPDLIRESATLSSIAKLPVGRKTTSGESTPG